jgi:cytochrome oxidase assembly protein ShyY1
MKSYEENDKINSNTNTAKKVPAEILLPGVPYSTFAKYMMETIGVGSKVSGTYTDSDGSGSGSNSNSNSSEEGFYGHYLHDHEVLLGPRSAPPGLVTTAAQGMATNPQGYYIITPFVLQPNKHIIFVNRGWVPRSFIENDKKEKKRNLNSNINQTQTQTQTQGREMKINRPINNLYLRNIILSKEEEKGRFVVKNTPQAIHTKKLLWVELDAVESAAAFGDDISGGGRVVDHVAEAEAEIEVDVNTNNSSSWWYSSSNAKSSEAQAKHEHEHENKKYKNTPLSSNSAHSDINEKTIGGNLIQPPMTDSDIESRMGVGSVRESGTSVQPILVEIINPSTNTNTNTSATNSSTSTFDYPIARTYKNLVEFSVTPETHATYAVTWFSLATAGVFMTKKLLFKK